MAKWGEGDPRWIVEDRPDSTNVNNWHWTEKNCFPWAEQYLRAALGEVRADGADGLSANVKEVTSIEGDVTLGNRKGKVYNLYDLTIVLAWEGRAGSDEVAAASGSIKISNVTQDETVDEYDYEVTCYDETPQKRKVKEVARTKLVATIKKKLVDFVAALKVGARPLVSGTEFASKVLLPTKDQVAKGSTSPSPSSSQNLRESATTAEVAPAPKPAPAKAAAKAATGETVTLEVDLLASAQDVFDVLMQPSRAQIWTQAAAVVSPAAGSELSLYGGNVAGKTVDAVPGKRIHQQWRLQSWPAGRFSDVTMELDQGSASTTVRLRQTNVPIEHAPAMEAEWQRFYFDRIKAAFGWGIPSDFSR